jgi:hypothetical protein
MPIEPAYARARTSLGALIDGAPDHLVGEYACVLEELDELCGDVPLEAAGRAAHGERADQYQVARAAVEGVAARAADRFGFQLCLARLDATWDAELARGQR